MKSKFVKKIILKVLFAVCIVLIIGVIGAISTKIFISDNLDSFKGDEHKAAMEAMITAEIGCLDHPVARLLNQKVSAPSAAWRFLQGASPCRAKPNQQPVPSVAQLKEFDKWNERQW